MKLVTKVYDETLSSNENQFYNTLQWEFKEKTEFNALLNTNQLLVPLSHIDAIKVIIVESDADVEVIIERESDNINFFVSNLFVYTPSLDEGEDIMSFQVYEHYGIDANVRVRVYGYKLEPATDSYSYS